MRALVVYESMFGNTQRVAEAIGEGLRERYEVEVREVGQVDVAGPELEGVDLLVVGGPIHAWSMTRASSREGARQEAEGAAIVSTGPGIREFLRELHDANPDQHPVAATFDTAMQTRWFPIGSAAKPAAKQLSKHGYALVAKPEHFYVTDKQGPLVEGELERARAWASQLASEPAPVESKSR